MKENNSLTRSLVDIGAELEGVSDSLLILSQLFADEQSQIANCNAVYGALFATRAQIDRIVEDIDCIAADTLDKALIG